jgi:hypothetical protein
MNDTPGLLKNTAAKKNWIIVKTVGKRSNRNGIGARVIVTAEGRKQTDEVRSGGSYISQNDMRLHFGLGSATKADRIEVLWPGGSKEVVAGVKANQVVVIRER